MSNNGAEQNIINAVPLTRHHYKKQGTNYSRNEKKAEELDLTD